MLKIRIVSDTVDGDELAPIPPERNEFRRRFVPEGIFAVVHSGNMGKKQGLDLLLRTADRLRDDKGIHFFVFGEGAVKTEFLRRRAELQLDNVFHYPLQERWMLSHMLSGADVVLISQLPQVVDIVVPSKLITSLAAGSFVVAACADDSETARLVKMSGGGCVVEADNEEALAQMICKARDGDFDSATCRKRGREEEADYFSALAEKYLL